MFNVINEFIVNKLGMTSVKHYIMNTGQTIENIFK